MGHLGGICLLIHLLTSCQSLDSRSACEQTQFSCSNGRCIPRLWECDGNRDCDDGADELICNERSCSEFVCKDGGCVARSTLCDGTSDCTDGSDELEVNCGVLKCKRDEFVCNESRRCISLRFRCNGADDCGDGSDEAFCKNCTGDYFLCGQTGNCVPRTKLCDGQPDCPGGQDKGRDKCPSALPLSPLTCSNSEFHCGDGQCVPHSWRCDHSPDCDDGSDEVNCDQNECLVNNGGCSHLCLDQPMGYLCDCPSGMRLVRDTHCEAIDMCLDADVCNQLCVRVNGSFICDCHEGYLMSPGTGECKAKGDIAQLVFSSSEGLRLVSTSGTEYREIGSGLFGPGALTFLATNRTLYWAQWGQGSVYRISMDGKAQRPVLLLQGQGAVFGLAVDWIHKLLYLTDANNHSIRVVTLDGSSQQLIIGGLDRPTGVAVEPLLGLLFWADSGSSPRIERADRNGHDRMLLVTSVIRNPVAISLDMPRQLLYWADAGTRTISRVDFEGHHRKTVVESNGYLDKPFGLAVFEGHVYWSEETTHSICVAEKHNGSLFHVLLQSVLSPGSIALVHPVLQPKGNLISDTVLLHTVSDSTFAGILSLIVLLSVLLVGMALWWWRVEFRTSRTLIPQDVSLKESQDPLIHVLVRPSNMSC